MTDATQTLWKFLEAQDRLGGWHTFVMDSETGEIRPASGLEVSMFHLLKRIREWDVLNPSEPDGSDAPYWQREIARVIGA